LSFSSVGFMIFAVVKMDKESLESLKNWFLSNKRDFPWRENPLPYAVWVSEVMLQQTQASVVIPYFLRWMERFPTIRDLAEASLDAVIKEWEGLGYYSRARSLHEGAQYVVANFQGKLPDEFESLNQIKGLGPYTIGAILNFAFHRRAAAVDGNVLRVLARYYGLDDDISKVKTVKKIRELTLALLPKKDPWVISEALIELGALLCGRTPQCEKCPLRSSCAANLQGATSRLPVKGTKAATQSLYRAVAVISCENHLLIGRGIQGKVMADLCEFPYFESEALHHDGRAFSAFLSKEFGLDVKHKQSLSSVKHTFTRYRVLLIPHLYQTYKMVDVEGFKWLEIDALQKLAFSSGHRRIFAEVQPLLGESLAIT
jgi:A/G-specific adenine glycosylase